MNEDIEALIEEGCMIRVGENILSVNWDLMRALHPNLAEEIWNDHLSEVDETLDRLVEKGYLETSFQVNDDGSLAMIFQLTEAGKAIQTGLRIL